MKDYKVAAKNYSEKKLEQVFYTLEDYDLRSKGVNNPSVKEGELLKELVSRILN
jgi:DNA polymerase-3 subunit delta